jgi:hypothetical protein
MFFKVKKKNIFFLSIYNIKLNKKKYNKIKIQIIQVIQKMFMIFHEF